MVVDNGYLNWGITIPPMKNALNIAETRWSQWLESLRKDVKSTFGMLKGRFRILKAGITCKGVVFADNIWKTCYALHNMILEVDGITGEWDGVNGLFDSDRESETIPLAIHILVDPLKQRDYVSSGMDPGFITESNNDDNVDGAISEPTVDDGMLRSDSD